MRFTFLSPLHKEALLDPQTWRDNPFVNRELRRDIKRKQPTKLFAILAVMMFGLLGLGIAGLWLAMNNGLRIPWYLGGDVGTVLCILIAGLHIWFVSASSANRSILLLQQEAHRDTLSSLLLLPMSPFQLLLQAGIYPWLVGMRTALVLLPLYVFCVALDGISWLDLAMLYVVFALASVSFPIWRKPILSETALVATTPLATPGTNTGAMQAATGATPTTSGVQATNSANTSGGWMALFFMVPMILTGLAMMQSRTASGQGLRDMLSAYVPDSVLSLMLPSMLSWPLLIARGLITPFTWFGWHVAPLPFVIVFFLLARYLQLVRTSEFLSVGTFRDLAAQPTYIRRRKVEGAARIGQLFVVIGYLWIWAVRDGGIGFLVHTGGKTNPAAAGLAGFVYLAFVVTVWRGLARVCQLATWQRGVRAARVAVRSVSPQAAMRYLVEPFVFLALFLPVCALFAGVNPFTPVLLSLMGRMLAIGLAGMLFNYGATRLMGSFVPLLAIAVVAAWATLLTQYHLTLVQPLEYLSTTLGLVYAGHLPWLAGAVFEPGAVWWRWPLMCGAGGLLLTLAAVAMRIRVAAVLPENVTPVLLDPTRVGEETFSDAPLTLKGEKPKLSDTPIALRLIAALQRGWDNAVMVKELRVRLRGKLEFTSVRAIAIILIVITVALYQGIPAVPLFFVGGMAKALFGKETVGGAILCCFYITALFRALIGGFTPFTAFMVERDKSTLGFLLLTPMSALSIVFGKLAGILLPGGLFLATVGVWTLFLSLLNLPDLGLTTLVVWGEIMFTTAVLILTIGVSTLALASIFPKIPMQYAGCLWAILLQVVVQGTVNLARFIVPLVSKIDATIGLSPIEVWLLGIILAILLMLLALFVAVRGVMRMRAKDLTFAASKKEN